MKARLAIRTNKQPANKLEDALCIQARVIAFDHNNGVKVFDSAKDILEKIKTLQERLLTQREYKRAKPIELKMWQTSAEPGDYCIGIGYRNDTCTAVLTWKLEEAVPS